MSNTQSNVQEIFGKFAVELAEGGVLFATLEEAVAAETEFIKGAEFRNEAAAFCANQGIEGKNAKSKTNILIAYFAWVEAGKPEAPVADVVADEATDTTTDETTDVVADDADDAEVEF
jgi:hypothetical protein